MQIFWWDQDEQFYHLAHLLSITPCDLGPWPYAYPIWNFTISHFRGLHSYWYQIFWCSIQWNDPSSSTFIFYLNLTTKIISLNNIRCLLLDMHFPFLYGPTSIWMWVVIMSPTLRCIVISSFVNSHCDPCSNLWVVKSWSLGSYATCPLWLDERNEYWHFGTSVHHHL